MRTAYFELCTGDQVHADTRQLLPFVPQSQSRLETTPIVIDPLVFVPLMGKR